MLTLGTKTKIPIFRFLTHFPVFNIASYQNLHLFIRILSLLAKKLVGHAALNEGIKVALSSSA